MAWLPVHFYVVKAETYNRVIFTKSISNSSIPKSTLNCIIPSITGAVEILDYNRELTAGAKQSDDIPFDK